MSADTYSDFYLYIQTKIESDLRICITWLFARSEVLPDAAVNFTVLSTLVLYGIPLACKKNHIFMGILCEILIGDSRKYPDTSTEYKCAVIFISSTITLGDIIFLYFTNNLEDSGTLTSKFPEILLLYLKTKPRPIIVKTPGYFNMLVKRNQK